LFGSLARLLERAGFRGPPFRDPGGRLVRPRSRELGACVTLERRVPEGVDPSPELELESEALSAKPGDRDDRRQPRRRGDDAESDRMGTLARVPGTTAGDFDESRRRSPV
jgi:hypothetical protein